MVFKLYLYRAACSGTFFKLYYYVNLYINKVFFTKKAYIHIIFDIKCFFKVYSIYFSVKKC